MKQLYFFVWEYSKLPAILVHELSHWIIRFIQSLFLAQSLPYIEFVKPTCKKVLDNNIYTIYSTSFGATCYYFTPEGYEEPKLIDLLAIIAPLFSTIFFLFFAKSYLFIYVILHLPTFLPSTDDWEKFWNEGGKYLKLWH